MDKKQPRHPAPTDLVAAARGALEARATRSVRDHCLVCEQCAARFEAVLILRRAFALPASDLERSAVPVLSSSAVH